MFKKRLIKRTADGSNTIYLPHLDEHYHSIHGAIKESQHVFIKNGLENFHNCSISILEIGFGTGLNALLTCLETERLKLTINYTGIEAYPVSKNQALSMDYCKLIDHENCKSIYHKLHEPIWERSYEITKNFALEKKLMLFQDLTYKNAFNLVYFDAFGARVQPELWTEDIFKIMYNLMIKDGILVTYSAKGSVRRAMQRVGFAVERLPGPPGKREMLRARKMQNGE